VAYSETLIATADSRVRVAARVGLKALGLDHLPEAILRYVQISPNWENLLRAEVKKVQAQLLKLDEAQLREGKRKRCDATEYIFDHGIKGVRRVMNKHGTVTGLQQVDHSCPKASTGRPLPWNFPDPISKLRCMSGRPPYRPTSMKSPLLTHIKISAKFLTDVPALLTWVPKHPSPFTSLPTLAYSNGPWTKDNLVTAVEFFFQRNITPSPSAAILRSIATRFHLLRL